MHRTPLLLAALTLCAAGCSSPPSPIELRPRFVPNTKRVEGVQAYVELRTKIKDWRAHIGIEWDARVVSAGAEGAVVEAKISGYDLQLPNGFSMDSGSLLGRAMRLGHGTPLGLLPRLLEKLHGGTFRYTVSPSGEIAVQRWDELVAKAAAEAEGEVPQDGSFPAQEEVAAALSRAYAMIPHASMELGGSKEVELDYRLETEEGARVSGTNRLTYLGFGEAEFEVAGDEGEVEGLHLGMSGQVRIEEGKSRFGVLQERPSQRQAMLLMSEAGDALLFYRERVVTEIHPATTIEWLDSIRVADYSGGWLVYARGPWR